MTGFITSNNLQTSAQINTIFQSTSIHSCAAFSSSPITIISATSSNSLEDTDLGTEMKIKSVTKLLFSD